MKPKYFLAVLLLSILATGAFAAGSPINENFSNLITLSNDAIEAGKQGDKQAFIEKINTALTALKDQDEKGSSIRLQRASSKLKSALKAAKAADLQTAIDQVQQGITIMQIVK
ncbi:MAG: hypothetical protein ABSB19_06270 [Methylomonas sp.]|jgi:hypothetical protein